MPQLVQVFPWCLFNCFHCMIDKIHSFKQTPSLFEVSRFSAHQVVHLDSAHCKSFDWKSWSVLIIKLAGRDITLRGERKLRWVMRLLSYQSIEPRMPLFLGVSFWFLWLLRSLGLFWFLPIFPSQIQHLRHDFDFFSLSNHWALYLDGHNCVTPRRSQCPKKVR